MARSAFTVAANQGLLYVLSMVVIGGLVGAGALGYDVVAGFKQLDTRGRGLAAGFSIVLLGVMLDRITTYTARRLGRRGPHERSGKLILDPGHDAVGLILAPGAARRRPAPSRRRQASSVTPCGDVNMAVNPWVGYEADAFVVGEVASKRARLHGQLQVPRRAGLLAGLRQRRGRRRDRELGPPRADRRTTSRSCTSPRTPGASASPGMIGWYVPPWMAEEVPRHHELEEPEQVRRPVQDVRVGRQGPAARRRPGLRHQRRGAGEEPQAELQGRLRRQRGGADPGVPGRRGEQEAGDRLLLRAAVVPRRGAAGEGEPAEVQDRAATRTRRRSPATTRTTR